jgi:hypothetical protein
MTRKQEPSGKLKSLMWMTQSLTYSFSIRTPESLIYRQDGFETVQEAHDARNILGIKLAIQGLGIWVNPPYREPKPYYRRGPRSSEDSLLTEMTFSGSSLAGLTPEMLPDTPGRITERKLRYKV